MQDRHRLGTRERRARDRRVVWAGLLVSLGIHLTVFLGWRQTVVPLSPFAAAGPRAADPRAAQAGGLELMALREVAAVPLRPPPVPLPTAAEVEPVEFDSIPALEVGSMLADASGLGAPGIGPPGLPAGFGRGDGGAASEGRFGLVPASPRGMIIPPSNPSLKGRRIEVWVFVDAEGRVVADSTRLQPPTSDGGFNQRLIREAADWVFEPARKGGEAVASWFPYTIGM